MSHILIKNIFSQKAASAHAAEAQEADEGVSAGGGAQAQAVPGRHQRRREARGRGQRGTELPGRDPGRQRGVTRGTWRGDTRVAARHVRKTSQVCAQRFTRHECEVSDQKSSSRPRCGGCHA